jgi:hypothetical protein
VHVNDGAAFSTQRRMVTPQRDQLAREAQEIDHGLVAERAFDPSASRATRGARPA